MAGYKTISMVLLIVLVVLAGVSPVFAVYDLNLDPEAACPGVTVVVTINDDVVGGGISVASVLPLGNGPVLSSDPDGLIANQVCDQNGCTFQVSGSATCGGHYTLTMGGLQLHSPPFDVPSTCCPAVGGCVQPVNTFALLSPWLAVIGLFGCIGTVVVVAKKRHS